MKITINKKKKTRKTKTGTASCPRNGDSVIETEANRRSKFEEVKQESKSVLLHQSQQSQEGFRISKHSSRFPKAFGHQTHSASAKRENGLEGDVNADKDSGESSQKVLKLDFQRLHSGYDQNNPERITMKNIKNREEGMTKSYWSSSGEVECISPMNFSLKNLNFSTLVNNQDGKTLRESASQNDVSFGDVTDENSVKMYRASTRLKNLPPQSETP